MPDVLFLVSLSVNCAAALMSRPIWPRSVTCTERPAIRPVDSARRETLPRSGAARAA
jgi:hypothetical protein